MWRVLASDGVVSYWMLCSTTGVDDRGGGEDDNKWGNGEKTRGGGTIYEGNPTRHICRRCTSDTATAAVFCAEASRLLEQGGMRLCEWTSNDLRALDGIAQTERCQGTTTNLLGLAWSTMKDTLNVKQLFAVQLQKRYTKRDVLTGLNSCFDPLGIVLPIVMGGRMIYRDVCKEVKNWDEFISSELADKWTLFLTDLMQVHQVQISRWAGECLEKHKLQVHVFTDESTGEDATAAVAYLAGNGRSHFFAAKGSVTKKGLTTPKVEMEGVVLGGRLMKRIRNMMDIEGGRCTIWTDSQVVCNKRRIKGLRTSSYKRG
eukprot:GHVQ01011936.1.p2 GENE.GHVQ01011936.1~~GHVQ01011936.1.p2  ORF type:complete len:316 (+),score=43.97 GHVQ01011936.1:1943-2890(+)